MAQSKASSGLCASSWPWLCEQDDLIGQARCVRERGLYIVFSLQVYECLLYTAPRCYAISRWCDLALCIGGKLGLPFLLEIPERPSSLPHKLLASFESESIF